MSQLCFPWPIDKLEAHTTYEGVLRPTAGGGKEVSIVGLLLTDLHGEIIRMEAQGEAFDY